ncbi:hypothetical protein N3K66_005805 [Trichothecium roseum]|uniref:Uncharacterized protein n=1 Tax=Trichothecium roseum TaxID=47278 RepID=A0ACC0V0A6_9HYPO|nr:hypothetical protein N3K66_005805 [Trichothecium roseum]
MSVPSEASGAGHAASHVEANAPPINPGRSDSKMSIHGDLDSPSPTFRITDDDSFRPGPRKSQSYMDSLIPPTQGDFERIAHVQERKEEELKQRNREARHHALEEYRHKAEHGDERERAHAAERIQRTFRGYRARREMEGYGLDASTRWISAFREAQFRETTRPKSNGSGNGTEANGKQSQAPTDEQRSARIRARDRWRKISVIARRAGHDDLESDSSSLSSLDDDAGSEQRKAHDEQRQKKIAAQRHDARMMGLQYFLEMVDLKHRYGSNLRMYHQEWKKADTSENFFYWLDYGEGKNVELAQCPRDRLHREQIRYLSREERQYYLVTTDDQGRLRWAKNGVRVDTSNQYKDSIHGIVPADDPTPAFNPNAPPPSSPPPSRRPSSMSSIRSKREADQAAKYPTPDFDHAHGMKKISHVNAFTIWNKILRKSVKEGTWIFVADTAYRLYVGIKNSGAFQHSSFLQGSRLAAAGLIKIKDGRITSLSPLSGHYRPPASNFRSFVKSLKEGGVDMSHVSISKSYIVLAGLETYLKTRRKSKNILGKLVYHKDKLVDPEEFERQQEASKDKSKSAQREREVIQQEEKEREENKATMKVMQKLGIPPVGPQGQKGDVDEGSEERVLENMEEKATGDENTGVDIADVPTNENILEKEKPSTGKSEGQGSHTLMEPQERT